MSDESQSKEDKKTNIIVALVCVVVIVVVGTALLIRNHSSSSADKNDDTGNASMTLSPSSQSPAKDSDVSVSVWAHSSGLSVNAVQANLSYPTDMFDFVSIDTSNSAFSLDAQSLGNDGKVAIARGSTTPLRGNLLVGVVKLHSKQKAGKAKLSFTDGTALLSDTSHKDVLVTKSGATYTVK